MKAKNLFLSFLAFLASLAAANAEDLYIIKDGELQKGFHMVESFSSMNFGVGVGKETVYLTAAYTPSTDEGHWGFVSFCSDDKPIDLNENYILSIEFYVPLWGFASKAPTCIEAGFSSDTTGGNYGRDFSFCNFNLDLQDRYRYGVFRPDGCYTLNAYIYTTPVNNMASELYLRCNNNYDFYIKNLKLTTDGDNKPFFAEDFHYNGASDRTAFKAFHPLSEENEKIHDQLYGGILPIVGTKDIAYSKCGVPLYVTYAENNVKLFRPSVDTGWDSGINECDYYNKNLQNPMRMLMFENPGRIKETGMSGRVFYPIPMSGLEGAKQFRIDARVKWDPSMKDEKFSTCKDHDSLALRMAYMFVDDPEEAFTATPHYFSAGSTPEKPETDSIPRLEHKWTLYKQYVDVDATKKYFCVIMDTAKYFSYLVGDLKVRVVEAGPNVSYIGSVGFDPETGIKGYIMGQGASVEAVKGDNVSAVIYPNPATDVINVLDAEAVVVYNALGQVVASSASSQVNVSSLAAGLYTVKAQTANGTVVGKIVKR